MDSSAFDDTAFPFFCIGCLTFYLVPSWYSILHRIFKAFRVDEKEIGATSRTKVEQAKAEALKKENSAANVLATRFFLANLAVTVIFSLLFAWFLWTVQKDRDDNVNSFFDPFSILGVDRDASRSVIKKAYHRLSLLHHYDHCHRKGVDPEACTEKQVAINKAYETLTDEKARMNWENTGHPDGKQSITFRYGLPSVLLDSNYRNLVLVTYLMLIVGIIPYIVWRYYSKSIKYGEKNVMYNTYSWYHQALNEKMDLRNLPEVLAGSAEFRGRNRPKTESEKQVIATILQAVRQHMLQPRFNNAICVQGNALLHAHLLRKTDDLMPLSNNKVTRHERDNLNYMLQESSRLIDAMISVCHHQNALSTLLSCINLGQYVMQAMWVKDSNLLQLPHFTDQHVQRCRKAEKVQNIRQYRSLSDDQKDSALAGLTAAEKKDVSEFLHIFPEMAVSTRVFVDDDEDDRVYAEDLVTIQVTITRTNLADGEQAGLVHAPYFPFPRQEIVWVVFGQAQEGKVLSVEKVTCPDRTVVHNIKFLAPPTGTYHFDLFVKSNGYVGVDEHQKVELTTLDKSALPEYKVHPDDALLDDEPTLFEEMMRLNQEEDDSDDDEDSDDEDQGQEEIAQARRPVTTRKKMQLRAARQDTDDDE